MGYIGLYLEFIKITALAKMENRASFLFTTLAKVMGFGSSAIVTWIMVDQFKTIGGWSAYEIMFLFSLNLTTYSLAAFFLYHPFTKLPYRIRSGEFDEILTKPLNPMIYLVSREVSTGYVGNLLASISICVLAIHKLSIPVSLVNMTILIISIIGGSLIQGALFIFSYTPSFWLIQNNSIADILGDLTSFTRYPLSIYNRAIQILLTLVLPYGFISFYPAQYFLGKDDFLLFHPVFQYLSILVGIIVFAGAYMFWNFALKHYKSTGS